MSPAAPAPRRAGFARAAAVAVALGAVAVTLGPAGLRPDLTGDATLDRLLGGLVAGVAVAVAWPRRWLPVAVLVVAIIALEAAQRLAPGRHGEAIDAGVKLAGALAGAAAVRLIDRRGGGRSPVRGAAVAAIVGAALAAIAWWLLAPPAAVRREMATRAWPAAALACHPPGPLPTIDVWGRTPDRFAASLRHGHVKTGCVLGFRRDGLAWRLDAVRVAPH